MRFSTSLLENLSSWAKLCPSEPASPRRRHRSDWTFWRVSTADVRRADLPRAGLNRLVVTHSGHRPSRSSTDRGSRSGVTVDYVCRFANRGEKAENTVLRNLGTAVSTSRPLQSCLPCRNGARSHFGSQVSGESRLGCVYGDFSGYAQQAVGLEVERLRSSIIFSLGGSFAVIDASGRAAAPPISPTSSTLRIASECLSSWTGAASSP
jgi:hypothetical protein